MQASFWVMRHASSGPIKDAKADDKRPLDPIGQREAKAAGIALKSLKTPIQCCMSSPLKRSMETAELVCAELGLEIYPEEKLAGQPLSVADVKSIMDGYGNCLLVGHSPSLNLVVYQFTGAQMQLSKGGLAQIHEGELWAILNASTCLAMSGMGDQFDNPGEVDHRSSDDWVREPTRVSRAYAL